MHGVQAKHAGLMNPKQITDPTPAKKGKPPPSEHDETKAVDQGKLHANVLC